MKRLHFFVNSIFLLSICFVNAQNGQGGIPPSFKYEANKLRFTQKPFIAPVNFSVEELKKEDVYTNKAGMPLRIAHAIPVRLNLKSGLWNILEGGEKVWQLPIKASDAEGIILSFSEMYIPDGAKLFVYTADRSQLVGAYTLEDNPDGLNFATPVLFQDEVMLEYVPSPLSEEQPIINISKVGYVYNMIRTVDAGQDISCMVNVNCEEGDNWRSQSKSVLAMDMEFSDGWYICTGSLINNTRNDGTPYVITADHCIADGNDTINFRTVKFHFFKETAGCTSVGYTSSTTSTLTGAELLVDIPYYVGSDGALLKLTAEIPSVWDVFFNGWDVSGEAALSGVAIHHPDGAVKTISTYTEALQSAQFDNETPRDAHWEVYWAETQNGQSVTAGGSSGSPLYSQDGLVVGTLTGGSSYCRRNSNGGPNSSDFFGKMSLHWESGNGQKRIKDYLDPDNSGVIKLAGFRPLDVGIKIEKPEKIQLVVFADGEGIVINAGSIIDDIMIYDLTGRLVYNISNISSSAFNIQEYIRPGVYTIVAKTRTGIFSTKFVK